MTIDGAVVATEREDRYYKKRRTRKITSYAVALGLGSSTSTYYVHGSLSVMKCFTLGEKF